LHVTDEQLKVLLLELTQSLALLLLCFDVVADPPHPSDLDALPRPAFLVVDPFHSIRELRSLKQLHSSNLPNHPKLNAESLWLMGENESNLKC
jgi:hypothetical protein